MQKTIGNEFPGPGHDHHRCIESALGEADRLCREQGLRLTPLRRRVFELVWENHQPITAYSLLDKLVQMGHRAQAPTVYRSLDFLLQSGLIHRIESMNAYVGCNQPRQGHDVGLFICDGFGDAAELADDAISEGLARAEARIGFTVDARVIEIRGTCRACRQHGTA